MNKIQEYIDADIHKLAFARNNKDFKDISKEDFDNLLLQISVRQKHFIKFPMLVHNYNYQFPSALATEQASSEFAASYKSQLACNSLKTLDLTGGLGIDSIYFAKTSFCHWYIESSSQLCNIFTKNIKTLGLNNIQIYNISAEECLLSKNWNTYFDLIYVDPSRRKNTTKSFLIKDSVPDISKLQIHFPKFTKKMMLKLSPLFDIKEALRQISNVSEVHIISINNDCKELLLVCDYTKEQNTNSNAVKFVAVNMITFLQKERLTCNNINSYIKNIEKLEITEQIETIHNNNDVTYSNAKRYILEPNTSIMKLGCWHTLCTRFNIHKLHPLSHIFTSDSLENANTFPGNIYEVIASVPFNYKEVRKVIVGKYANVKCRNFPYSVEEVKRTLKLVDGGEYYLFATSQAPSGKPVIIITKKF